MKKIKKPKFEVGDIIVGHNGFKRLIRSVVYDYLHEDNRIGYSYYNEAIDEHFRAIPDEWNRYNIGMCSEAHLLTWGNLEK